MRELLGDHCRVSPLDLDIVHHRSGKPALRGSATRFNLTHAEDLALLAISEAIDVGVDVEMIPAHVSDQLIAAVCSGGEQDWLSKVSVACRPRAFTGLWVAKEAYLKAAGIGLTGLRFIRHLSLENVVRNQEGEYGATRLQLFEPRDGYLAAVANAPICH
jgi:4'-phosphopantetheinyl transferase